MAIVNAIHQNVCWYDSPQEGVNNRRQALRSRSPESVLLIG